jgi:hypothetical protein
MGAVLLPPGVNQIAVIYIYNMFSNRKVLKYYLQNTLIIPFVQDRLDQNAALDESICNPWSPE